ncbi:MAG: hypothetical protein ACYSW2_06705 [Planctomycetota bacterium]|jgi:hypothetical protein
MYEFFRDLDRRWIFLLMLLAVAIPILFELSFPEEATGLAQNVFEEIEKLEEGAPSPMTSIPAARASWPRWPPPSPSTAARKS